MGNNQAGSPNIHTDTLKVPQSARTRTGNQTTISEIVSPKDRALFRDKSFTMKKYLDAETDRIRYNSNQLDWEEVSTYDRSSQRNKSERICATERAEAIRQKARTQSGATFEDTQARLAGWNNRKRLSRRVTQKFDEAISPAVISDLQKKFLSQEVDTHEFELSGTSNQPDCNTPQALCDSQLSDIPEEDMTLQMIFMATIASFTKKFGKFIEDKEYADESWKTEAITQQFPITKEVYYGQMKDGKRNGRGDQVWADGSVYQGYWKNDMRSGRGRYISNDGGLYEGHWRENMLHGTGKCVYSNGKKYQGGWYNNKKHGIGTETFADNSKYEGKYLRGLRHGKGQQTWPDGSIYTGEFDQDAMGGYGAMKWADGRRYVGEWKENMMHGKGVFTWKDGKRYVGDYSDNMKNGNGEFEWADGSKYKGTFLNNKMHGQGVFNTKDSKTKKGEWNEGQLVKWL